MAGDELYASGIVRLKARLDRSRIKATHFYRVAKAHLYKPSVGIVGAYNTGNVGDVSLAYVLSETARRLGISFGIYSYSGWDRYPFTENAVIGGGGIVHKHGKLFETIVSKRHRHTNKTVFVGVSGELFDDEADPQEIAFLRDVPFIAARSRRSQLNLSNLTLRDDVKFYPDLAFGLPRIYGVRPYASASDENTKRTLGISVSPQLMSVHNGLFLAGQQPSSWYKKHVPSLVDIYHKVGPSYVNYVRRAVEGFIRMGYRVLVLPFAVEDVVFAKTILKGLHVEHHKYDTSPKRLLEAVAQCDIMVATRYHAHVFALSLGVPVLSIAYASKCEELWTDFDLPFESQVHMREIVDEQDDALERFFGAQPARLEASAIELVQDQALKSAEIALGYLS